MRSDKWHVTPDMNNLSKLQGPSTSSLGVKVFEDLDEKGNFSLYVLFDFCCCCYIGATIPTFQVISDLRYAGFLLHWHKGTIWLSVSFLSTCHPREVVVLGLVGLVILVGLEVVVSLSNTSLGLGSSHGVAVKAREGAAPLRSGHWPERGSRVSRSTRTNNSTASAILGVRCHSEKKEWSNLGMPIRRGKGGVLSKPEKIYRYRKDIVAEKVKLNK